MLVHQNMEMPFWRTWADLNSLPGIWSNKETTERKLIKTKDYKVVVICIKSWLFDKWF